MGELLWFGKFLELIFLKTDLTLCALYRYLKYILPGENPKEETCNARGRTGLIPDHRAEEIDK
jgi:hypothetical protein